MKVINIDKELSIRLKYLSGSFKYGEVVSGCQVSHGKGERYHAY